MGLTAFSGDFPTLKDVEIAKNYLTEDELKILNNIVSGYFDFAEERFETVYNGAKSDLKNVQILIYIPV
jgi:hypothetical protein